MVHAGVKPFNIQILETLWKHLSVSDKKGVVLSPGSECVQEPFPVINITINTIQVELTS